MEFRYESQWLTCPRAPLARLTSAVVWRRVSRTNTSSTGVPLRARFAACESNATTRPPAETALRVEELSPAAPFRPLARLTNVVVWRSRSRTKTSFQEPVRSRVKLLDADVNETTRPS